MVDGKVVYEPGVGRYSLVVNGNDYERFNDLAVAKDAADTHKRLFPKDDVKVVDTYAG